MTHDRSALVLLGWALLTPPYGATPQDVWLCPGCGDPGHLEEWSDMQMSRCFPEERVGKGRLRPGE